MMCSEKGKHQALRPQKPLGTGKLGGREFYIQRLLNTLSPPEWLCINVGSCVRHWNVSLIVWATSQDSVHKPQFLKRKESRRGSNRGPHAYQHSALPLSHTGSRVPRATSWALTYIGPWDSGRWWCCRLVCHMGKRVNPVNKLYVSSRWWGFPAKARLSLDDCVLPQLFTACIKQPTWNAGQSCVFNIIRRDI